MASASVKMVSCEGCSLKHHPNHSQLYAHAVSSKTMAFCGDECAHSYLNIKPSPSAAAAAASTTTGQQQVGARARRGESSTGMMNNAEAEEFAGFDEVEKTLLKAQRDAERAQRDADPNTMDSDASDSDASSGFDSDSSAGSSDGGSRRRRRTAQKKRSKKSRAAKALKKSLMATLNAMLKVSAKLLIMAEQNLSVANIKAGLKILSKGVSLAMKIIPVLLPLLPLLILARRGEKQSVPDYLKAELKNLMRMIESIIAGVKSARLTRADLTNLKNITMGVLREFSQFIGQKKTEFTMPKQQQQQQQQQQMQGRAEVETSDLFGSSKPK